MTSELRHRKRAFARRRAQQAIAAARAQGCACQPDVLVEWNTGEHVSHISLGHQDWCPLLRVMQERPPAARTQAFVSFDEPGGQAP
jgi:hypothetical protein